MGTAFCFPLGDAGHTVKLVGTHLDREWIRSICETGVHPKLKMKLPETVTAHTHDQLSEALGAGVDLLVLGVSSAGVGWAVEQLGPRWKGGAPLLMLTKGLQAREETLQVFPQVVRERLAAYGIDAQMGGVGGPCIAAELAARRHTSVMIGFADAATLQSVMRLFAVPYYHARPSLDVVGVEVCAALKNFYALAVGCPAGLLTREEKPANAALMHNLSSGLFAQALAEMALLVDFLGGQEASVMGLAGAGDLYVTCQAGRNSRMGNLLGSGLTYSEAKATRMASDTVEGAELAFVLAPVFERLFHEERLDRKALPLTSAILDMVCRDAPARFPWTEFHYNG